MGLGDGLCRGDALLLHKGFGEIPGALVPVGQGEEMLQFDAFHGVGVLVGHEGQFVVEVVADEMFVPGEQGAFLAGEVFDIALERGLEGQHEAVVGAVLEGVAEVGGHVPHEGAQQVEVLGIGHLAVAGQEQPLAHVVREALDAVRTVGDVVETVGGEHRARLGAPLGVAAEFAVECRHMLGRGSRDARAACRAG